MQIEMITVITGILSLISIISSAVLGVVLWLYKDLKEQVIEIKKEQDKKTNVELCNSIHKAIDEKLSISNTQSAEVEKKLDCIVRKIDKMAMYIGLIIQRENIALPEPIFEGKGVVQQ